MEFSSRVGSRTHKTRHYSSLHRCSNVSIFINYFRHYFDLVCETEIVEKKVKDVREALRKFRDQMLEQIQKGITNPQLCL